MKRRLSSNHVTESVTMRTHVEREVGSASHQSSYSQTKQDDLCEGSSQGFFIKEVRVNNRSAKENENFQLHTNLSKALKRLFIGTDIFIVL